MGNVKTAKQETNRARQWIRELSLDQIHALLDALILGDFEWREWLENRPSGAKTSSSAYMTRGSVNPDTARRPS